VLEYKASLITVKEKEKRDKSCLRIIKNIQPISVGVGREELEVLRN